MLVLREKEAQYGTKRAAEIPSKFGGISIDFYTKEENGVVTMDTDPLITLHLYEQVYKQKPDMEKWRKNRSYQLEIAKSVISILKKLKMRIVWE